MKKADALSAASIVSPHADPRLRGVLPDDAVRAWSVYLIANANVPPLKRYVKGSRYLYVGITKDVKRRLQTHNAGKVTSTRGGVWLLQCHWPGLTAKEASVIEHWFKQGNTREKRLAFWEAFRPSQPLGRPMMLFMAEVRRCNYADLSACCPSVPDILGIDSAFGTTLW
jgi:predicted GIY-YIG superfamily endonuclease